MYFSGIFFNCLCVNLINCSSNFNMSSSNFNETIFGLSSEQISQEQFDKDLDAMEKRSLLQSTDNDDRSRSQRLVLQNSRNITASRGEGHSLTDTLHTINEFKSDSTDLRGNGGICKYCPPRMSLLSTDNNHLESFRNSRVHSASCLCRPPVATSISGSSKLIDDEDFQPADLLSSMKLDEINGRSTSQKNCEDTCDEQRSSLRSTFNNDISNRVLENSKLVTSRGGENFNYPLIEINGRSPALQRNEKQETLSKASESIRNSKGQSRPKYKFIASFTCWYKYPRQLVCT